LGYEVNINVSGIAHHRRSRPWPGLKQSLSLGGSQDDLAGIHAPGEFQQRRGHVFAADGVENAPDVGG
jgi:hypothetical protein